MTAADGHVVRTTKVVDHGPAADRWNMVILSEGYRESELDKFHADAEGFIARLFATAPFDRLWCGLNIFRVDVASTDSGADDPATCGDGTAGTGASANTFFDATFCTNNTRRLLAGDEVLANATAHAQVPEAHGAVVIVNTATYGGAGGAVAWFSTHPDAAEIGLHELGHTLTFGLDDEYGDIHDTWAGGEPTAPNVTADTARSTTKWHDLIQTSTPLPTMSNPDCTAEDNRPSPEPAGTVGLFEGGGRAHCGLYRSEHGCRMRTLGQAFCAVCRRVITQALENFMPVAAGPSLGVQFQGTVPAGQTRTWFTYDWPACWHVLWTVVPLTIHPTEPQIDWQVKVERANRERITYWIRIENLTAASVDVESRYAVVART